MRDQIRTGRGGKDVQDNDGGDEEQIQQPSSIVAIYNRNDRAELH